MLNRFPSLHVIPVRGNVDTRLRKIKTDNLAGVVLAAAGILRMGFGHRITSYLDTTLMIPAIGQGALAIETRVDDRTTNSVVTTLNDPDTARCVAVERAFLKRLGGGCQVPMAAHCTSHGETLHVVAAVVHPDGTPMVHDSIQGSDAAQHMGIRLADRLLEQGAGDILRGVLGDNWKPAPDR